MVLVCVLSALVIAAIVGAAVLRHGLVKRATDNLILDSSTPVRVLGKPVDYGICEEPLILFRDPDNGLLVPAGVRPDRFASRNQVFYEGIDCTGAAYLAPPAVPPPVGVLPPALPVGYLNGGLDLNAAGERVVYGVGAPAAWPACTLGVDCGAGSLFRSTGDPPAVPVPPVLSVWTSLAPDCAFGPGTTAVSLVTQICQDVTEPLVLVAATEVLVDAADPASPNLLEPFTPPFFVMELTITPTAPTAEAPAPAGTPPPVTFTDPEPEAVKP